MIIASKLGWTVSKRPQWCPDTMGGIGESPTLEDYVRLGGKVIPVTEHFSLVRDLDNRIFGPAGKDYVVTQNSTAFDFFKKFTDAGKMVMETAGALQGGRQVWVLAKLMSSFVLPGGDEVWGYLLFSLPHVWGKALVIKFVTVRVICSNTFAMAMNESTYGRGFRMPHIRAFDEEVEQEALTTLGIATELFEAFEEKAKTLASTKISDEVVVRYIADIFQKDLVTEQFGKGFYRQPERDQATQLVAANAPKLDPQKLKRVAFDTYRAVSSQPGADLESSRGTAWGAYNAVSYYLDHLSGRDRDNALYSSWFGPKAAQKKEALGRALQLVEATS
jgi:phage/plasmid-like protein (TIGR03299 family)